MEANFPKMEEEVLRKWKEQRAFETSLKRRKKAPRFVFYEGPPTANAGPGFHHVLSRVFKDVICRYKTMRGFLVERKAGWDTHGLPVELQVEKKLGLKSKKDIERYGIAKFNKECRNSVWEFKKEWEDLTERVGFWIDMEHPYVSYEKEYMETLWWIIKQFWQKGLLYKGYKVVPYCPRCGTPLSSHEMAQGYKTTTDKSVYVRFRVTSQEFLQKHDLPRETYILAWTTTPWTLPGNVALAVGKEIEYIIYQTATTEERKEAFIVAKKILEKNPELLPQKAGRVIEGRPQASLIPNKNIKGSGLEGVEYKPLFDSLKSQPEKKHYVALADFVSTEEGTGIVHTAVMYGEEDYRLGAKLGLPKRHTVDEEGKFNELVSQWQGMFVKDAEPLIIEDLKKRNLLYKEELYEHEYPFCWRCSTPLLYYAKDSWFVDMQKVKKELIRNNQSINWIPSHIKDGRMGEWLSEVKDWAFSRERYWGTPLPVWECDSCAHRQVVGSLDDLKAHTASSNSYYLLRHGHSTRQQTNVVSSFPEKVHVPLTPRGVRDIMKLAKTLKKKKIDLIFSSDLLRTKQTAEIVGKELGLKPRYDKRLRELDTGAFNGKQFEEFIEFFRKEGETPMEHYMRRFSLRPPRGEHWGDVQKRAGRFLEDMEKKYQGKSFLLVSHEMPLMLLEKIGKGLSREEFVQERMRKKIQPGEARRLSYAQLPYNEDGEIDLHRPYVDRVEFACPRCLASPDPAKRGRKGRMKRVRDVVDVWFDSGSMPFASASAKATADKQGRISPPNPYPADYIVEAIDQTRGWFYTLLAVATLLGLKAPYKNVISLGHLLDEKGEKMSKSKGNVVDPWQMIGKYGVDTLRWYFYSLNHPWDSKLFAERDVQQAMRKFILTLWNSFVFYQTYAKKSTLSSDRVPRRMTGQNLKTTNILDRWIVSRLNGRIKNITEELDKYDITGAGRALERFVVEDLSLWYIRRSRQRFQNPASKQELQEASATLEYVLAQVSKLTAPFIPFLSEYIHREIGGRASVHWEDWPEANLRMVDKKLEDQMEMILEIVAKGLAERAKAGIKVRQPLQKLKVKSMPRTEAKLPVRGEKLKIRDDLIQLVKDEVNVKEVVFDKNIKQDVELDTKVTPALQKEGILREIMRHIQGMRKQAGYKPQQKVRLRYSTEGSLEDVLRKSRDAIMSSVGLKEMVEGRRPRQRFDAQEEVHIEGQKLWLGIKKMKSEKHAPYRSEASGSG